jgi:hypothetical protein
MSISENYPNVIQLSAIHRLWSWVYIRIVSEGALLLRVLNGRLAINSSATSRERSDARTAWRPFSIVRQPRFKDLVLVSLRGTTDRVPNRQRYPNIQRSAFWIIWKKWIILTKEQGLTTKEVLTTKNFYMVCTYNGGEKLYKAITRSSRTINIDLELPHSLWVSDSQLPCDFGGDDALELVFLA